MPPPEVLGDLVRVFEERSELDHLVVAVTDWMTDSHIIGAHVFSNRVRWKRHKETLYVDPDPEFPGRKLVIDDPSRDLILHAGDPSPLQAFHFGAHRALQASQVYRRLRDARPHNARVQWQYLDRVWHTTSDREIGGSGWRCSRRTWFSGDSFRRPPTSTRMPLCSPRSEH